MRTLSYIPVCDASTLVCLHYPGSQLPQTDFHAGAFAVDVRRDQKTAKDCYSSFAGNSVKEKTISGVAFEINQNGNGALGHTLESSDYVTFYNNQCWILSLRIATENRSANLPGQGFRELSVVDREGVNKVLEQILSTFRFLQPAGETDAVSSSKLALAIPSTWQKYAKTFQQLHFQFSYPSWLTIDDGDESSGDIYIRRGPNQPEQLAIGRLSYYGFREYDGGSRRQWFLKGIRQIHPGQPLNDSDFTFSSVDFANGNSFLEVEYNGIPNDNPLPGGYNSNFYFGIFAGKAIMAFDMKSLKREDVLTILQSLKVGE